MCHGITRRSSPQADRCKVRHKVRAAEHDTESEEEDVGSGVAGQARGTDRPDGEMDGKVDDENQRGVNDGDWVCPDSQYVVPL